MKAVIMAGGMGSRIASVSGELPKPMLPIGGVPVLEREIESLRAQGICNIILTVGHLGQKIIDYFGDGSGCSPVTEKPFGVHISYFQEEVPLGNAGALFRLRDQLTSDFLLLNGDVVFDVDFSRMIAFHRQKGGLATILTHPNSHPYDSGLIITDEQQTVCNWLTKESPRPRYYKNRVNAGIHILSPTLLDRKPFNQKVDLDRQLLKPLAGTGALFAYDSPEYVHDMGTPERYAAVCEDVLQGRSAARNLRKKQKAIFLDRDGTINRMAGFLHQPEELELLPGAAEAVRRINQSGYLAILVTNQPVIARGEISFSQLEEIHRALETLLGLNGAYLDAIYFCPHHPDKGYYGEIAELKFDCNCRKPKPGMLLRAAEEFHIDLTASWMLGDSKRDIQAAIAAGCFSGLIGTEEFGQTITSESLLGLTKQIFC